MSLFKKPKKTIQRRVFSCGDEHGDEDEMQADHSDKHKERDRKSDRKTKDNGKSHKKTSLLSFDDEEEGEVFQVKKSSHSKKVMKMMDKERKKKKSKDSNTTSNSYNEHHSDFKQSVRSAAIDSDNSGTRTNSNNSNSVQTEIRTDDGFVLVVKKSEPSKVILNGRAALCAGRDDMSSEDEDQSQSDQRHRFNKPDNFKTVLESGAIPDAAMIHAARKRRQKAREQGDFIPIEEKSQESKKGRLVREGDDDIDEDEERVDMSAINGAKEREERREKFYSVQQEYSGDDSDTEINEWENQQIRKGVTGAQLVTAQQESSIYSQYLIKSTADSCNDVQLSTGDLLEQAYAKSCLEKPRQMILSTQKKSNKPSGPRMPKEVVNKMRERLVQVRDLHNKHLDDIDQLTRDLRLVKMDELNCEQNAPIAAIRYRFYQELRGYVTDLVECLDEKVPLIVELERKTIALMSKQALMLIERRRQDVRDQAKEMAEIGKPGAARKMLDDEEQVRRAADREGRRTRRRQNRERIDINNTHLDGMSSDDEIHQERDMLNFKAQIEQISSEVSVLFDDVTEEFSQISSVLERFEEWRKNDFNSYKDTYFSLCLPKILGPLIRLHLITWNPLDEHCEDLERMDWYALTMKYGWNENETEESLSDDPDVKLVPVLIEKIILPKVTELIETCWDPLSTSQTLKLVGLIGRLGRDYPSLKTTSKYLRTLFAAISDKMKLALDNDVFIPVFPKQSQEARSSFFQRQFCSGLKLLRNLLSFQGILADSALKDYAILSLLNRYLLMAMRVCTPIDATSKAYIIVNTLPRIWLQPEQGILESLGLFTTYLKMVFKQLDKRNQLHTDSIDKMSQILHTLHVIV
ncbi:PAX3- and PAX7-binding protein 1 [Pseudolycoriella hygida]|uniref:PAX3- and PAX7-binding protein 1 n=1 Tax=Pseudolycoriella hygida TaxID=35572 RepID=A0A9Q0RWM3_9DIPT|nr:PAX3- and PAX7-binding protein 1 [Pseudolycoriella hygida]